MTRASVLSLAAMVCGIIALFIISIWAVNGSRIDAQAAATAAAAEVQSLQKQARCRDDLAAAVDLANSEALEGLANYIRALSQPAGDPGAVDWDAILGRMGEVQSLRAGTEQTCA